MVYHIKRSTLFDPLQIVILNFVVVLIDQSVCSECCLRLSPICKCINKQIVPLKTKRKAEKHNPPLLFRD